MKVLRLVLLVCLIAMAATMANAVDFNTGSYARSVGMGGAGLALTDQSTGVNPASYATANSKLRFIFPSIDMHTQGASMSDFQDRTDEIGDSNLDEVVQLARDFGRERTTLNVSLMTGIEGPLGVAFEGEAEGLIDPSDGMKTWVNAGLPTDPVAVAALGLNPLTFANGTTVAGTLLYAAPAVSYGLGFDSAEGDKIWVGTKVKWLNSEVHSWNVNSVVGADVQLEANELPVVEDDGLAADLGIIIKPANSKVQWGMVINNVVDPELNGVDTPSMLSLGTAYQPNSRMVIAADFVNVNRAYNENPRLRFGAEWKLTRSIALRGGYTGDNFTCGFGAFGMDFSFSSDSPAMLSHALRF